MSKTQVYLFAPNFVKGIGNIKSAYLPYAVGAVWSYAVTDPVIPEHFNLAKLGFLREPIDDIVDSIVGPAICGFSTYIWNEEYNQQLARAIKQKHPDTLICFGGPNVPNDPIDYARWREKNHWVDVTVRFEGEQSFQQFLLDYVNNSVKKDYVSSRMDNLDVPSPFLTGMFDALVKDEKFRWSMILETNRGCPFQCTFCDWGGLTYSKIKKFPLQRVLDEITWAGKNNIEYIICADANFGVFSERDNQIVDHVIEVNKKYGYPKIFTATWHKNSNKIIIDMADKLKTSGLGRGITLSVQSMNADTLKAIKRQNMKVNDLTDMYSQCNQKNIPFYTELILGLPLETLETWQDGHFNLLEMGQHDSVYVFPVEVLCNSELALDRERYKIKSTTISDYWTCDITGISETQTVVTETNTMTTQDLIDATIVSWVLITFHHHGWTQIYSRYLRAVHGMSYQDIYLNLFDWIKTDPWLSQELQNVRKKVEKFYIESKGIGYYSIWDTVITLFKNKEQSHSALANWFKSLYNGKNLEQVINLQENFIVDPKNSNVKVLKQKNNLLSVILGLEDKIIDNKRSYQLTPRGDAWTSDDEFLTFVVLRSREGFGKYYVD